MYKKQEWKDEIPDLSKPILDSTGKQKVDPQTGRPLWELVQEGTRITSSRLDHMEDGIQAAHDSIENISQSLTPESIGAAKQSDFKTHIESTTAHAASSITVNDPEFADKNVLGVLKYLKSLANSIKTKVAAAIGSPATGEDTGDQLAKKINDAKAVGASNLVAKGVPATATESLATLFGKISNIIRGSGNAQPPEVLTGKTFTNNGGVPLTGTMPFRSAENVHMPSTAHTVWAGDRVFLQPPYGYYDGASWVTAAAPHLKPENIRSGVDILGISGVLVEGRRWAYGTSGSNGDVEISGLAFKPSIIIIDCDPYGSTKRRSVYIESPKGNDGENLYPNMYGSGNRWVINPNGFSVGLGFWSKDPVPYTWKAFE